MNYSAPAFGAAPVAAAAPASITKIVVIIVIVTVVVVVAFLGIVAIALGIGLGLGLRKSDPVPTKLSPPTVDCDSALATCGCATTKPTFSARIINGDTAIPNSWPWMVYLTINSVKICSGFLISQRHILTAASCVRTAGNNMTVNYGISSYQSQLGAVNVTNATYIIDNFDSVAIVTLVLNITYSSSVRPCCLSSDLAEPNINQNGVILGWGETSDSTLGNPAPTLQQAVVQVQNPSACAVSSTDNQFCAGFGAVSACPIDAGGPIMTGASSAWTCVGIITSKSTCGTPITFTRIAAYQAFIKNVTGIGF